MPLLQEVIISKVYKLPQLRVVLKSPRLRKASLSIATSLRLHIDCALDSLSVQCD